MTTSFLNKPNSFKFNQIQLKLTDLLAMLRNFVSPNFRIFGSGNGELLQMSLDKDSVNVKNHEIEILREISETTRL